MTKPPQPERHPTTAIGVAHRLNQVTGTFAAQPRGANRVVLTVSVEYGNFIADAVEAWITAGEIARHWHPSQGGQPEDAA